MIQKIKVFVKCVQKNKASTEIFRHIQIWYTAYIPSVYAVYTKSIQAVYRFRLTC